MRGSTAALALVVALGAAGCALNPASYQNFDHWTVGSPSQDYDDWGMEQIPLLRRVYGPLLVAPYAVRDGARIATSPLAFLYYELAGEGDGPSGRAPYWDDDLP